MSTPTPPPALTPQRLIADRYRLRRVIGKGSMGVVWLAYDEVLHRPVAVKEVQLPEGMPAHEADAARERTLREARAIAALTHPNVVAVHDVAKQGAEPFVVMELLTGRSLAQLLNRSGPLNSEQAAMIADAVAAGLDAAHRRGITHRDVKPGNVLVGDDGQVKLTDFGISRNVSEVTMTSRGLILGTPAYIAPEVAAGEEVTSAADLWGLGATLFAAVEGRPPYAGGNPLETVNRVVHGEIPRPRPDAPLAEVIAALMVREPADRISLVEVRRRIRALLPEPGSRVFPPDESEPDPGPADDKPTTALAANALPTIDPGPTPLAPEPGPLPWPTGGFGARPPLPPGAVPLAAAPGPLPFARRRVAPRRRGPVATAALLTLAVVLFAAAAGGGFVAARALAGQGLAPPVAQSPPAMMPAPPVRQYEAQSAQAAVPGTQAGTFTLQVPVGWVEFVEQRSQQTPLPTSTVVHWIKQDGTSEITVERFAGFYPNHLVSTYLRALHASTPGAVVEQPSAVATPAGDGSAPATEQYRTLGTNRTMYLAFRPQGADLWVLTVTVPTDQEGDATAALFDRVRGAFTITS